MAPVRWTLAARTQLEEVAEYVAKDSSDYARTIVTRAIRAAASLESFPLRGRVVPEWNDDRLREIFVDSYRLMFRITDDHVFVVAFFHSARDLAAKSAP